VLLTMHHLVDHLEGDAPAIRGECRIFSALAAIGTGLAAAGGAVTAAGAAVGAPLAAGLGALGVGAGTAGVIGTGAGIGLMGSTASTIGNHIKQFAEGENPFRHPGKAILGDLANIGMGTVTGGLTGGAGGALGGAGGGIIGEAAKGVATGALSGAASGVGNAALHGGNLGQAALKGAATGGAGGLAGSVTGAIPRPYEVTAPAPMTDVSGQSSMGSQYVPNTGGQMMANQAVSGLRPLSSRFASSGVNMAMSQPPPAGPMSPYAHNTPWWAR
jgi:hypothetical protein